MMDFSRPRRWPPHVFSSSVSRSFWAVHGHSTEPRLPRDLVTTPDFSAVTLSPNDCAFLIQGSDDPRERLGDIACGTLDVPENWSHPEGRRIQIGYLVLKSTAAQPMRSGRLSGRWAGLQPVDQREGSGLGSSPVCGKSGTSSSSTSAEPASPRRSAARPTAWPGDGPPLMEDESAGNAGAAGLSGRADEPGRALAESPRQYGPSADACVRQIMETGVDLGQYTTMPAPTTSSPSSRRWATTTTTSTASRMAPGWRWKSCAAIPRADCAASFSIRPIPGNQDLRAVVDSHA